MSYFTKKRRSLGMYAAVTITLLALCTWRLEIDWGLILVNFQVSVVRFTKTYLPMDFSQLREQLYQLWITVVISIAGAFVGMLLAFFSALAISSKTSRYRVLKYLVRALASLTRNIPEAVWAVLLLPLLWYGDFLGFLVLCIISYGFLTRSFADSIDETNASCIKALEATGANYWQIVVHAVIPETMPSLISWTLYAAENNIRSATVVGMLAGGGIGYLMSIYQGGLYIGYMGYQLMASCILLIIITVIITDKISAQIRKRII